LILKLYVGIKLDFETGKKTVCWLSFIRTL